MNKKTIISMVLGCMSLLPASAQNGWFVEAGGGGGNMAYGDALINFIPEQSPIAVFYTIDSVRK